MAPGSTYESVERSGERPAVTPPRGRRVLVTGLGSFWGGRIAQALEDDPCVEVILGLDTTEPTVELERTEYVRVDANYSILHKIVAAAKIDTIIHTFLIVDPTIMTARAMHEVNVIGTMNLFAAASAPDSTVRNVIVKSSTAVYGCAASDPTWFTEDMEPSAPLRRPVERSLDQVESYVRDFAEDNPHVRVSLLRFSNVIGTEISTPLTRALELPLVPSVLGFDPRFQFVHESDVIRSILYVLDHDLSGVYNVAGDGLLPWSEVVSLCGKRRLPLMARVTSLATLPLRQFGLSGLPEEYLNLLRYGRGVDNTKLKQSGFEYDYTSAQAIKAFIEGLRLRRTVGSHSGEYRYERDVEQFFRHSPAVVREAPPYDRRKPSDATDEAIEATDDRIDSQR
ncbi:MAG TPA: NAD-dependent epimerase/dehydratase family protein [Microthrixaceae bacterium]|mgnify:CR=1 FL=1|nr:NAD-dependent epimerase/dehydratase family protein [Microthrixaceae bacterium]